MSTIVIDETTREPQTGPVLPTAIKWGVISAAFSFLFLLVTYNLGLMDMSGGFGTTAIVGLVAIVIGIGILVLGMKEYRDKVLGGRMTWVQGLVYALAYGAVATLLGLVLSYVFYAFLAPNYFEEMAAGMTTMMEDFGADDDAIAAAIADLNLSGVLTSQAIQGFVGTAVIGAIVAAVLKRS